MFNYVQGNKVECLFLGDELGTKFLSCVRVNMVIYWAYLLMEKSFSQSLVSVVNLFHVLSILHSLYEDVCAHDMGPWGNLVGYKWAGCSLKFFCGQCTISEMNKVAFSICHFLWSWTLTPFLYCVLFFNFRLNFHGTRSQNANKTYFWMK